MKILIFLSLFFLSLSIVLIIEYFRLKKDCKCSKRDVKRLIRTLEKVRYGQLDARVKALYNNDLQWSVNRLIETLEDREKMIVEYQNSLSDKNVALEKMIKNEKEAQKFKEDFIATLTHDMKTPVIGELNTLDFLLEGRFGELNDKQKEALNLMKTSNAELLELVEVLLETYKIEQASLSLKKEKVKLNQFITGIIDEMKPIAQSSSHDIILSASKSAIEIEIDTFQMKRVLKNLILNAVSFCTNGSDIKVKVFKEAQYAAISVSNFGQGISKEDLDLIFNKYYTSVKKFRKMGTGLGLYLANQIVKAHEGTITVESVENEKTTFTVKLPLG